MKKYGCVSLRRAAKRAFTAALTAAVCASAVFAAGRPGGILSWGAGGRALALGSAATAPGIEDAFSPYYNSAALGFIERKEVGTFHSILWEETSYSYLAYIHPMVDKGAMGFDLIRLYSGGAVKTDENNRVIGDFANQQISLGFSYGKAVLDKFSLGVKARILSNSLDTQSSNSFAFDAGALYKISASADAGISAANIVSMTMGDTSDTLPPVVKIGAGYKVFGDRLRLAADFGSTGSGGFGDAYSFGVESRINKYFAARLGKNREEMTGGFGVAFGDFNLDYALAFHYLGLSHRVSLGFRFGKSVTEIKELARKAAAAAKIIESADATVAGVPENEQQIIAFQENYQSAINMYKRGLFTIALDRFKNAANIDPTDPDVPLYVERLNLITPIVPQNMSADKVSELMRRGIVYFVEGHGQNSVKTLAYALSLEPDNFTLMRLLGRVEEKTGYRLDRSQPASGLTLVDKMQYESLIAFKKKDYAETIKLCEEILLLEPDNALALKRMGSAFYALGEKEKAKKMWEKANGIVFDKRLDELIKKIK